MTSPIKRLRLGLAAVAAAALIGMVWIAPARAVPFTSDLTVPNSAISGYTSPYGTVDISLSNQVATITFTSNLSSGYLFGDSGSAAVEVNSNSFTLGGPTLTGPGISGFTAPTCAKAGCFSSGAVDGFGKFNAVVDLFDGFTNAAHIISFTVTNNSSTLWNTAANVLTLNPNQFDAAAHIFVCNDIPCTAAGGAVATGYAGEGPGTPVPEPASLALFGTALVGLGFLGFVANRRRGA